MQNYDLTKIMFLDIETVPQKSAFDELPDELAYLWEEKFVSLKKYLPEKYDDNCTAAEAFCTSAGIYSEFGKIVCISVGFIYYKNNEMCFRTKSFAGDDETKILTDFAKLITDSWNTNEHRFCGHNVKEFDIPYICRRMIINRVVIPPILDVAGKKPWEVAFLDTLELWKFGDKKSYTSLKLLTCVLGIPTPKDDIDGSQVAEVYYRERNIDRIATYCQKDVLATAQVFLRLNQLELLMDSNIEHL
ncbi:3'-5' exonuclease [Paludibacter sp. 221]|uniref:3'-5' exonuclease n=1 Tax=Paludibacter sp. 221 TaxID=2302939 RepID=UPI0013CF4AD0|nr:3'-5' exonuclease [Paludibacter sp. 221]NDV46985.1 3'-5' exonuclease [Paludibacter sp. 221]